MSNENMQGKLVVFYPVAQGVGGKYVTTNVANTYKELFPEKKVALVDFDFKAPYLAGYLTDNDKIHGVDNLIEKIDGGFLDEELFMENMVKMDSGIELLKGTKLRNNHYFIEPKHIMEIVKLLRQAYDAVFVSVSSQADNAGTTASLFEADELIIVSRNDFTCFSLAEGTLEVANHYKKESTVLKWVYNQHNEASNLDFNGFIGENALQVIGVVPFNKDAIDNRDLKGKAFGNLLKRKRQETPFDEVVKGLEI